MKRIYQISLIISLFTILSIPAFGQAGSISYSQNFYSTGYHTEWIINVNELKSVRFTYTADVVYGPPMISIYELSTDGITYNSIFNISGYTSGSVCTNAKTGKAKVVFNAWAIGNAVFNIQYSADNSILTNSDLQVGGNGTITGNLTVNSKLSVPSTTASNSIMGKLGIGTPFPNATFQVVGKQMVGTGIQGFILGNSSLQIQQGPSIETSLNLWQYGRANAIIGSKPDDTNLYITNDYDPQGLGFAKHSITLTAEGNVGVGTNSPNNLFEVVGSNSTTLEASGFYNTYTYNNSDKAETRINIGKIEGSIRQPMGAIGAFPLSNYDSNYGNLVFYTRNSQNMIERVRIDNDGNVGIGNSSSGSKLSVSGDINITGSIGNGLVNDKFDYDGKTFGNYSMGWLGDSWKSGCATLWVSGWGGMKFFSKGAPRMVLEADGNVGIATTTPSANLQVGNNFSNVGSPTVRICTAAGGTGTVVDALHIDTHNDGDFDQGVAISLGLENSTAGAYTSRIVHYGNSEHHVSSKLQLQTHSDEGNKWNVGLFIDDKGQVGIGTTIPDQALTVKGTIHTNEVIIDVLSPITVPDFVFKPSYKLMPLNQVEQYVKTNSHLPEIPSASEVSKNGMNMGEMQNKLLQKIEELTLYMIDQQKTINKQSAKIEELEKKLK